MAETQNFANHVRWHPPFHFVASPLLLIYLIWSVVQLVRHPGWESGMNLILTIVIVITFFLTRVYALMVQDRLIRLEEQLRFQRVLPADLAQRAAGISIPFLVALRFASDEELAGLVRQVLDNKFAKPVEVKKAIRNWRGDYHRV